MKQLKYKKGDLVKIVEINESYNDDWIDEEKLLLNKEALIISTDSISPFPYSLKFKDAEIEVINQEMGIRLFEENELERID